MKKILIQVTIFFVFDFFLFNASAQQSIKDAICGAWDVANDTHEMPFKNHEGWNTKVEIRSDVFIFRYFAYGDEMIDIHPYSLKKELDSSFTISIDQDFERSPQRFKITLSGGQFVLKSKETDSLFRLRKTSNMQWYNYKEHTGSSKFLNGNWKVVLINGRFTHRYYFDIHIESYEKGHIITYKDYQKRTNSVSYDSMWMHNYFLYNLLSMDMGLGFGQSMSLKDANDESSTLRVSFSKDILYLYDQSKDIATYLVKASDANEFDWTSTLNNWERYHGRSRNIAITLLELLLRGSANQNSSSSDMKTKSCNQCSGTGKITDYRDNGNFLRTCPNCGGSGQVYY